MSEINLRSKNTGRLRHFEHSEAKIRQASKIAQELFERKKRSFEIIVREGTKDREELRVAIASLKNSIKREKRVIKIGQKGISNAEAFLREEEENINSMGPRIKRLFLFAFSKIPYFGRSVEPSPVVAVIQILIKRLEDELMLLFHSCKEIQKEVNDQETAIDVIERSFKKGLPLREGHAFSVMILSIRRQEQILQETRTKHVKTLIVLQKYSSNLMGAIKVAMKRQNKLMAWQRIQKFFPPMLVATAVGYAFGEDLFPIVYIVSTLAYISPTLIALKIELPSFPAIPQELSFQKIGSQ